MEKRALRREMIARRQGLEPAERARRSRAAQEALIATDWFHQARSLLLYLPIRGEVETGLLAEAARAAGKRLLLPRVEREPVPRLWLHQWVGEPVAGAYGIQEPAPDWPRVEPGEVDLAVVPGVAFDRTGNRLGYGGGYYDRTLPLMGRGRFVALAYAFQLVEALPAEPHDVRLHGIATEEGVIRCPPTV
ncbi:MAG: 5-formyltetrahydrofolate cyclo-ligase [Bacillota bacterium]